jgi:hypothetical protein
VAVGCIGDRPGQDIRRGLRSPSDIWPPNTSAPTGSSTWATYGQTVTPLHGVVEVDPLQVQIQVSHVAISWNSTLDINYLVQYVSALTSNTWTNLGPVVPGTGGKVTVFDLILGQPHKFYRVFSLP